MTGTDEHTLAVSARSSTRSTSSAVAACCSVANRPDPGPEAAERLRGNRALSAALTGITAAVVGVIADLGVYFAVHTLFTRTVSLDRAVLHLVVPDPSALRPVALGIAVVAAVPLFRVTWSVLRTLGVCAGLGLAAGLAGLPIT